MASSSARMHEYSTYHGAGMHFDGGFTDPRPFEMQSIAARPLSFRSSSEYRASAIPDQPFNIAADRMTPSHRVTDPSAIEEDRRPLTGDYGYKKAQLDRSHRRRNPNRQLLLSWLPELLASILSIALLISLIIVLRIFEGRPVTNLKLPPYLTLNGIIAAIATVNRACLIAPTCTALMQEMWISYINEGMRSKCRSRLGDMDLFSEASMGAWGCVQLLISKRRPM